MSVETSPVWRVSRILSRIGVAVVVILLAAGLALSMTGSLSTRPWLAAGVVVLATIPATSVVVVLIDNVRRRDWRFVFAATVVIALLAFGIATKL